MKKQKEPLFASVLVLAGLDGVASIDRSALHGMGVRHVRIMSSGKEAAHLLARQARGEHSDRNDAPPVDLVICDSTLSDMRGIQFVRILRTHPRLATMPVIVASAGASRKEVIAAVSAGCSGFLLRPYTTDAFAEQLELAARALPQAGNRLMAHAAQAAQAMDTRDFETALRSFQGVVSAAKPKAEQLYDEGMHRLEDGDFSGAITAFNRAVRLNVLYAEAYVGLARAWRAKGEPKQAQKYLRLAGEAYSRLQRFAEARGVFQQLARERPNMGNPLTGMGTTLLQQGDYTGAAKAFAEGSRLSPDTDINTHIARACHFTDKPVATAKHLCLAMERLGEQALAERVYKRLLEEPKKPDASLARPILSRFPRLHELVSVVRYTLRAYKDAPAPQNLADDMAA